MNQASKGWGRVFPLLLAAILASAGGCDSTAVWMEHASQGDASADVPAPAPPALEASAPAGTPSQLRGRAIRDSIQALQEECRRYGGGDWDRWSHQLDAFRAALRTRIDQTPVNYPCPATGATTEQLRAAYHMLEARGEPPLFEPEPAWYLAHILDPHCLEHFARSCPVVAVSRWLHSQGIDLIFVPIPKMTEVYPDRVASPCPPDRIIAPHVRKMLLDLLEQDVEVVDVLPRLLAAPDRDRKPLYLPDDPHWAPRGKQIAAEVIAERIRRYDFARTAQRQPPLFEWVALLDSMRGANFTALTPLQRVRCEPAQPVPATPFVVSRGGTGLVDEQAPLLLIGDSYNIGLDQCIAHELNMPIAIHTGGGHTTQAIVEAVRNPSLLQGRKVIVWTVCNPAVRTPRIPWPLPSVVARHVPSLR